MFSYFLHFYLFDTAPGFCHVSDDVPWSRRTRWWPGPCTSASSNEQRAVDASEARPRHAAAWIPCVAPRRATSAPAAARRLRRSAAVLSTSWPAWSPGAAVRAGASPAGAAGTQWTSDVIRPADTSGPDAASDGRTAPGTVPVAGRIRWTPEPRQGWPLPRERRPVPRQRRPVTRPRRHQGSQGCCARQACPAQDAAAVQGTQSQEGHQDGRGKLLLAFITSTFIAPTAQ